MFAPRRRRQALAVWLIAALAAPVAQADDAAELSQRLIALRGEVEALNDELALLRDEQRTQLLALSQQRADFDGQLKRQELALAEARDKIARSQAEQATQGAAGEALKPVLLAALDSLRNHVATNLPFKTGERLAALDELRTRIEAGQVPPARAANQVWAFIEDEFRLTRETGQFKQTISLDGEQVLVDVAKVGSMMLFFKAQDGRRGYARRQGAAWTFVQTTDAGEIAQIDRLFDSLGKQIRQGWFELPNTLTSGG
jgi:hypothetical protein